MPAKPQSKLDKSILARVNAAEKRRFRIVVNRALKLRYNNPNITAESAIKAAEETYDKRHQ